MNFPMNLHAHTWRCNHASGTEREYIENAIAAGFRTFGFSDHAPMPFPGNYYSTFRMRVEQTENYVRTILQLREEYGNRIQIPIGFEAEYYPAVFPKFLSLISKYPIDYIILGQHFLGNEEDAPYACRKTRDESMVDRYVNQVCEGLRTGAFSYLAHPDVICYEGDDASFRKYAVKLCECALETETPLEINLLGIRDHRHYPSERFFKIAAEVGNRVVLGLDAHDPNCILDQNSLQKAEKFAENCRLVISEDIPFHAPLAAVR